MNELADQQALRARCYHPTGQWEEFTEQALEQSVAARFEQIVARYPERLAVQMDGEPMRYGALNAAANQLAHAILAQRGPRAEPIGLIFDQSIHALIAMLAVWKAGKFFMALNPADPPARLAQYVQDAGATAILTTRQHHHLLATTRPSLTAIIVVDELADNLATTNPSLVLQPNDIACILYTSGSTGQPKGVVYSQRNVLYRAQQFINFMHICRDDRVALVEYYSFSGSLRDIFMTLLSGAALYLVNIKVSGVEQFAQLLSQAAITLWQPVTTSFRTVAPSLRAADLPHLRLLAIGGETIHRQDLEQYRACTPPTCLLSIGLGASETVGSIVRWWLDHDSELPTQTVPIGYPVEDIAVDLIDEVGNSLPVGETGQLIARSSELAQGYWQQPSLTAATFLPDPHDANRRIYLTGDLAVQQPDGQFVHLGRKDQQVKIRGHRVELPEVEQALVALGCFRNVAVVARKSRLGEQQLIAYLTPALATSPTITELRQRLQQALPEHLIPARFVLLDKFPLTVTGKLDRKALVAPDSQRPDLLTAYQAPRTPLETNVAAIWQTVLEVEPIGIYDSFLELGGNSLLALQVVGRVLTHFQVSIPIQHFFATPTVADMALLITQSQAAQTDSHTLQQLLDELEALANGERDRLQTVAVLP